MEGGKKRFILLKIKRKEVATLCIAVREISLLFLRKKSQHA